VPDPSPDHLLASLAQRGIALELQTVDVCFVAALYLRAERASLASFGEEQLADVFQQVCEVLEPSGEGRRRATHAIRRLREQRMLARVDGAGVTRAGEYALTRLATGIVEFFLEDETLTKGSLTLLTRSLLGSLHEIAAAARGTTTADELRASVVDPLKVSVADLMGGIQRRQRGFDVQQESFQREIASLLEADWFGAVDRCQSLLESTGETLRELNQVLLRDSHQLLAVLQEIAETAIAAGAPDADEAARGVMDQVDRIAAWGGARQRAWSEYYQYVHRFLRDVVRLDPARVLTHRLRERLAGKGGRPYALAVAASPPIRLLRAVTPLPSERPPVRRRKQREEGLDEVPAEDAHAKLEADVRAAMAGGARGLSEVTARVAEGAPEEGRYALAGRVAHAVAQVCRVDARAERPWVAVGEAMVVEEWGTRDEGDVTP
jgi:chromosome partition protein MukF